MDLPELDSTLLPPELLLDPAHPANDGYIRSTEEIKRLMLTVSSRLKPRTVRIVKLRHQGIPATEVARMLDITPATVSKNMHTPDAKRLTALLGYYGSMVAGPHIAQRNNMLWRIAKANEHDQPRVTISAIAELNKVEIALKESNASSDQQKAPIVVINQELLPRTNLDGDS